MDEIVVIEHASSRSETDTEAEFVYNVLNADSVLAAQAAVLAEAPDSFHGKYRGPMSITPTGPGQYNFKIKYSIIKVDLTIGFIAEKVKRMQSLETIANIQVNDIANNGAVGPDFGGLIGVSKDKVEGCEVYAKGYFTIDMKWQLPRDTLDSDYVEICMKNNATVNAYPVFLDHKGQRYYFDTGELLYIGGTFHDTKGEGCEVNLKFEGRYNDDEIIIGERSGRYPSVYSRLDGPIDASQTGIVVTTSAEFLAPVPFAVTIDFETLIVTDINGEIWTVLRGQNSTVAAVHDNNSLITYPGGGVAPPGSWYTKITKKGWEYIWIRSISKTDPNGTKTEKPDSAHIERVYNFWSFDELGVFTVINQQDETLANDLDEWQDEEEAEAGNIFGPLQGGGFIGVLLLATLFAQWFM